MSMHLMPPAAGTCPVCATKHADDQPHNAQSMYYQMRFNGIHGRWPTWADAADHCEPHIRAFWKQELTKKHAWSEPPEGIKPIAERPQDFTAKMVEMKDTTQTIRPTRLPAAPKRGKWPVYQIGRDFYAAPTRSKAVELAKKTTGITRDDLRTSGVARVTGKTLRQPLIDATSEEPVEATLASLRDAAQVAGEPRHLCSEQG